MSDNTNYPVQKPEGEWQAQLSPGMASDSFHYSDNDADISQSNSVSSARKAPSHPARENTTSTTRTLASIPAADAMRLSTKQTTNSTLVADGPLSGTPYPARWDRSRILV